MALTFLRRYLALLKNVRLRAESGLRRKYPRVIQLPITYKCNSRCAMCDVWNMDYSNEASLQEFESFLSDPLFSRVRAVGINGGEPTLVNDLPDYARAVLKLPRLQALNLISHGFHTPRLLRMLREIKKDCGQAGVSFHLSISLDGVGQIHDTVRGVPEVFHKTFKSIKEIQANQSAYCDSFDLGCTVVDQNADYLVELDEFVQSHDLAIKYRLGIANERIKSNKLLDQFSVLRKPSLQSAMEFFHSRIYKNGAEEWFKYFSIFYWLNARRPRRLMGCAWKQEGVTLDSRGELYYCAVISKPLGSLRSRAGSAIFFAEENLHYRASILRDSCDDCIHDYQGKPVFSDALTAIFSDLRRKNAMRWYQLLNLLRRVNP